MSTVTREGKPVKVERRLALLEPFDEQGKNALLRITMTRGSKVEVFHYWVDKIGADWGRAAFQFEKVGDPAGLEENAVYHVLITDAQNASCDCQGFLRWGTECKHIGSSRKLIELGLA